MRIDEIGSSGELSGVLSKESRSVLLDFWGTWCQPCRALRPHLAQMALEFADQWRILAINAESNADLAESFAVHATPTLAAPANPARVVVGSPDDRDCWRPGVLR